MIELSNGFQLDKAAEVTEIGGNGDRAPNLVSCFRTFVLSRCWISLSLHPSTIRFTRSGDALVVRPLQITKTRKYESTIKSKTEAEDHGGGARRMQPRPPFSSFFPRGTIGIDRSRTPVSSKMALPIAGAMATSGTTLKSSARILRTPLRVR
jgi:hypothetical protein